MLRLDDLARFSRSAELGSLSLSGDRVSNDADEVWRWALGINK
ncbi:MAG: hypothetical protein ACRCTL_01625 [Pseudomonas sp.]